MKKIIFILVFFSSLGFCGGTPTLTLSKSVIDEGALTYILEYDNIGDGTATTCTIYDQVPEPCEYVANSGTITYGTATIYYSKDGGASWQPSDPGTETKGIKWDIGIVTPIATGTVKFKVKKKD